MNDHHPTFRQRLDAAARKASDLPRPEPEAQALSDALTARIREEMAAAGGSIDFARYMELALYAPGLGYYVNGLRKFGAAGDFVTAPELSPLFGRCVARQCADVLGALDGGDVLEAGAGSGALAAAVLEELERLDRLPGSYFILELSAELRQRQRDTLHERVPGLVDRVRWLDTLPDAGFRGVVLANEVIDAMPVTRFRLDTGGPRSLDVTWGNDGFEWCEGDLASALVELVLARTAGRGLPRGYVSEIGPRGEAWVRTVGEMLAAGLVLIIDYGFARAELYHPQRTEGTLMCHYRHRAHDDPLVLPGLQDITAHVDFTALAEAAVAGGLAVMGYASQAAFLIASGLMDMAGESDPADAARHLRLTQQVKKLTLPSEMGELFKVIAFGRDCAGPLRGFSFQDQRGRL